MIFKFAILLVILFLIYLMFFKKSRLSDKDTEPIDTMHECPKCKTFILKEDAILSSGKYFCSKECLK